MCKGMIRQRKRLENPAKCANMTAMEKVNASRLRSLKRQGYAIAGVTHDGVAILKSPRGTSRLSDKQITAAVASVRSMAASALTQSDAKKR
jgi:hypothetical protein